MHFIDVHVQVYVCQLFSSFRLFRWMCLNAMQCNAIIFYMRAENFVTPLTTFIGQQHFCCYCYYLSCNGSCAFTKPKRQKQTGWVNECMRDQKEHYCLLPFYLSLWRISLDFLYLPPPLSLSLYKSFKFRLTVSVNFNYEHYKIWLIVPFVYTHTPTLSDLPNMAFASNKQKKTTANFFLPRSVW